MREIKFRVYTEISHEMLGIKYLRLKDVSAEYNNTLMQYTGLKDKNGKEIYEGDILLVEDEIGQTETDPAETSNHLAPVVFRESTAQFGVNILKPFCSGHWYDGGFTTFEQIRDTTGMESIEIIGNIYENPELLSKSPEQKELQN